MGKAIQFRKLAKRLIEANGKKVLLRHLTGSTVPPGGGVVVPKYKDVSVIGFIEAFRHDRINGTSIQTGDLEMLVSEPSLDDVVPVPDDFVFIGEDDAKGVRKMSVMAVAPTYADDVVMYSLHLRG